MVRALLPTILSDIETAIGRRFSFDASFDALDSLRSVTYLSPVVGLSLLSILAVIMF